MIAWNNILPKSEQSTLTHAVRDLLKMPWKRGGGSSGYNVCKVTVHTKFSFYKLSQFNKDNPKHYTEFIAILNILYIYGNSTLKHDEKFKYNVLFGFLTADPYHTNNNWLNKKCLSTKSASKEIKIRFGSKFILCTILITLCFHTLSGAQ